MVRQSTGGGESVGKRLARGDRARVERTTVRSSRVGHSVGVGPSDHITGTDVDLCGHETEALDLDRVNSREDWSENGGDDGDGVEAHVVELLNESEEKRNELRIG